MSCKVVRSVIEYKKTVFAEHSMKKDNFPEINKKYTTIAAYAFAVCALTVIFIMLFVYSAPIYVWVKKLIGILAPFFWGFAFSYVLCPVCNFFDRKLKNAKLKFIKNHGGLIITYIIFILCLALFFYIMIPQIIASFNSFASSYKNYGKHLATFFSKYTDSLKFISPELVKKLEDILNEFLSSAAELVTAVSPIVITKVSEFAMGIWKIVLGFIISIYMLSERKTFSRQAKKLLYAIFSKAKADRIMSSVHEIHYLFGGFINGKLLDSLIIGILCFIGLSALSMPYAPLVSVIVGVTNFIPYFGPFLGAIPSFVIIFFSDPIKALWFAVFILILQQIDGNLIGPKILKQAVGISSFWVIFSLLVMGGLFGVVGMVLAVPLFALIHLEISRAVNSKITQKLATGDISASDFTKEGIGAQKETNSVPDAETISHESEKNDRGY